jgi:hypothetical protein
MKIRFYTRKCLLLWNQKDVLKNLKKKFQNILYRILLD